MKCRIKVVKYTKHTTEDVCSLGDTQSKVSCVTIWELVPALFEMNTRYFID